MTEGDALWKNKYRLHDSCNAEGSFEVYAQDKLS